VPTWILSSLRAAVVALTHSGENHHADSVQRLIDDPAIRGLRLYRSRAAAELAEEIESCDELEQLFHLLRRLCSVFSVAHCTIQRIRERHVGRYGAKILSTYPDAWIEEYISRRYFMADPVVARMLQGPGIFFWDEIPYGGPMTEQFLQAAAAHDIGPAGITCVGENDAGDAFAVTLAVPLSNHAFREFFSPKLPDFVEIVSLIIEVFSDLTCSYPRGAAALTCDQIRVLRALAGGCTKEDLDAIPAMQTSMPYLERSILQSLNASSLVQAVAIAVKHGLLEVAPFDQDDLFRPEGWRLAVRHGSAA
jgi:Autoinducer binding domain